jgi:uncharacterized membrane protein (UPF0182 family)
MEETLEQAVTRIFQPGARPALPPAAAAEPGAIASASPPPSAAAGAAPPSGSLAVLSARAREHYQRAIEAQRAGDWARYGEEIRKLGEVLEQMRRQP